MRSVAKFRIFGNVKISNNKIILNVDNDTYNCEYYNDIADCIMAENLTPDDKIEIWGYIKPVKCFGYTIKTRYIAMGIVSIQPY